MLETNMRLDLAVVNDLNCNNIFMAMFSILVLTFGEIIYHAFLLTKLEYGGKMNFFGNFGGGFGTPSWSPLNGNTGDFGNGGMGAGGNAGPVGSGMPHGSLLHVAQPNLANTLLNRGDRGAWSHGLRGTICGHGDGGVLLPHAWRLPMWKFLGRYP
jgi:hypothetical protein